MVDPFAPNGVFTFASPPDAIASLVPDQIVVLAGLGLFKVVAVDTNEAGELVLTTEDAALTDAATEGRIAWDIGIRLDGLERAGLDGVDVVTAPLDELPVPPGYSRRPATPLNASFSVGRVSAKVVYSKSADQHQLAITLTGKEGIKVSGKAKVKFRNFRQHGLYEFAQSQANLAIGYDSFDVSGEAQFDLTEVNGTVKLDKRNFGLVYPFMVGPIPMYVQLGLGFEIDSTLANNGDTATANGTFAWRGDFGVDVVPGISQTPHVTTRQGRSDLGQASHTSQITTGVNVNFDAPRIDIGVGLVPPAPAQSVNLDGVQARVSLFAKMKTELVQNMEVLYDPLLGTLIGYCFRPAANFGLLWGGELRFFSVSASTEQQLYAIEKKGKPSGTVCK